LPFCPSQIPHTYAYHSETLVIHCPLDDGRPTCPKCVGISRKFVYLLKWNHASSVKKVIQNFRPISD
jgi:hypothetical protein